MPTDREVADAYSFALAHAEGYARRLRTRVSELTEVTRDAATDAVLWARENHKPERGEFLPFAKAAVRCFVRRKATRWLHQQRNRPLVRSLPAFDTDRPDTADPIGDALCARPVVGAGDIALPLSVRELPEELQAAVRFFYVDRFDLRECGLLLGVSMESVRQRLREAARVLGGGQVAPGRATGEKRMVR